MKAEAMNSETPETYEFRVKLGGAYVDGTMSKEDCYGALVVHAENLEKRNRRLEEALRKLDGRFPKEQFQGYWSLVFDYDDVKAIRAALTDQQEEKR